MIHTGAQLRAAREAAGLTRPVLAKLTGLLELSLERGFAWNFEGQQFKGFSLAGQSTSVFYKNEKIAFDIAQGLPFSLHAKLFCLSHLHSDHGSGINYVLAQRSLFRLPKAKILVPSETVKSLEIILKEWQKIEKFKYSYELIPVDHNLEYDCSDKVRVRAFATIHRVQSFGYIVYQKKKKLKKEYENLERQELLNLKSQKKEIEEIHWHPTTAFTGDTQIEFIDSHPDVSKADLLFLEATYLDSKRSVEETRFWGHTHLDEIVANKDRFQNKHLCFIHPSSRYSPEAAKAIFQQKLTEAPFNYSLFPRS